MTTINKDNLDKFPSALKSIMKPDLLGPGFVAKASDLKDFCFLEFDAFDIYEDLEATKCTIKMKSVQQSDKLIKVSDYIAMSKEEKSSCSFIELIGGRFSYNSLVSLNEKIENKTITPEEYANSFMYMFKSSSVNSLLKKITKKHEKIASSESFAPGFQKGMLAKINFYIWGDNLSEGEIVFGGFVPSEKKPNVLYWTAILVEKCWLMVGEAANRTAGEAKSLAAQRGRTIQVDDSLVASAPVVNEELTGW